MTGLAIFVVYISGATIVHKSVLYGTHPKSCVVELRHSAVQTIQCYLQINSELQSATVWYTTWHL